ncbi:uncharacterized protein LOC129616870 [Condylostylus longicornis]|uniref:uncharacterized protein LOC129616870 n=1 Tax=Condylostylus longicornis TaxID=2530218 RepID=UPI00244E37E2|nr:uncharacterized protein LOC129616870 [Condylostylus longicornis]
MKIVSICLVTLTFLYYVSADTHSQNATHPDYPGMCYYDDKPYPPGEHIIMKRCEKITCGSNSWVSIHGCIKTASSKPNCKRGDYFGVGMPFPECCLRKYKCTDENGDDYVDLDF